jgi:hypothetical protein
MVLPEKFIPQEINMVITKVIAIVQIITVVFLRIALNMAVILQSKFN